LTRFEVFYLAPRKRLFKVLSKCNHSYQFSVANLNSPARHSYFMNGRTHMRTMRM
jgi:hypothetical protein